MLAQRGGGAFKNGFLRSAHIAGAVGRGSRGCHPGDVLTDWYSEIDLSIQQALAKQAEKDGVTVKLQTTQVYQFSFVSRLTMKPAEATKKVLLQTSSSTPTAVNRTTFFRKWFRNGLFAVSGTHSGGFGQSVEQVFKSTVSGMSNPVGYSYDKTSNSYKGVEGKAWIDSNGFVHFTSSQSGEFVISEGPLEK